MVSKQDVVDIVEASVEALTEQITERLDQLTTRLQQLVPPQIEPYEPVSRVQSANASLDLIKSVPEFNGEMKSYPAWRDAAHFAMDFYVKGSENYYVAIGIFRNKITGTANDKLSSFNTVLNFEAIIARLDQCFGDKRSLQALENELSILQQGNRSISDFYDIVDQHLTLIINKNKMSFPGNIDVANALNSRARDNALRVFISGLKRPLSDILFSARPCDLPTALATAQELYSDRKRQEFAKIYAIGDFTGTSRPQRFNTNTLPIAHPSYENPNIRNTSVNLDRFNTNKSPIAHPSYTNLNTRNTGVNLDQQQTPIPMEVDPGSSMFRRQTEFSSQRRHGEKSGRNFQMKRDFQNVNSGRSAPIGKIQRVNYINTEPREFDLEEEDVVSEMEQPLYEEEDDEVVEDLNFLE